MLRDDFTKLLETMVAEENATILGKGEEYTRGQKDRLASFKETASFAGVKPIQVCMIYLNKHYQSLAHFVATGETKSNEPIEARIMDLRVYMALMRALIQEGREEKKTAAEVPGKVVPVEELLKPSVFPRNYVLAEPLPVEPFAGSESLGEWGCVGCGRAVRVEATGLFKEPLQLLSSCCGRPVHRRAVPR